MKKILLSLTLIIGFSVYGYSQEEGQFKFGAGINLYDISEAIGIQGKAIYGLNEMLDIGGAFTYWLDDFIDFQIDANVQYKGLDVSESFKLQPLAGFSYIKFPGVSVPGFGGVGGGSDTSIHVGASFRFTLESGMTIYAEPLLLLGSGSPINISGGILF